MFSSLEVHLSTRRFLSTLKNIPSHSNTLVCAVTVQQWTKGIQVALWAEKHSALTMWWGWNFNHDYFHFASPLLSFS